MISVPNHRRLLNGNNFLITFIGFALMFYSCGTTRKTTGAKKVVKPVEIPKEVVKPKQLPDKIDTIQWVVLPAVRNSSNHDNENNKILEVKKVTERPLQQVNLTALIPFKTDEVDPNERIIPINNLRFIQYYAGMKMALEEVKASDIIPVQFNVYDAKEGESLNDFFTSMKVLPNIIVGPYKSESLKFTAEWAKKNKTYVLSPWISSSTITEKNPYYFQAKAGLNAHYQLINRHVRANFPIANVILISKTKEDSRNRFFIVPDSTGLNFKEETIAEEDLATRVEPILDKFFKTEEPVVFILPFASSKDENYIYHFLRRVVSEKKNKVVYIYGMYKWLEMKPDILEYVNLLNVRLTMSNIVDADKESVKNFKRRYFETYHEFPSEDAMEGYDLAKYLVRSFQKRGAQFYLHEELDNSDYLETGFQFRPVYKNLTGNETEVDYYENNYIRLVEYREHKPIILE